MPELVLVTGASGFIAGHCIAELASHGYAVRGTVRRPGSAAHLADFAEFVTADLESDQGWAEAVAGCTYVLHVASPLPLIDPADENELIRPAVDGTLRVLRACAASGTVRRVVLTSSMAAVRPGGTQHDRTLTEEDWCDPATSDDPYQKSKALAELAAWKFIREQDTGEQGTGEDGSSSPGSSSPGSSRQVSAGQAAAMELAVINPGLALGPVQHAAAGTSLEPVRRLLAREIPGAPRLGWAIVDVRDLAVAHRLAMETPEAAGNRYICAGQNLWMRDMARILATRYRVPTLPVPYWGVWLISRFDPAVRGILGQLGIPELASADKAGKELGWAMRPVAETILDTAASLIEHNVVPAARIGNRSVTGPP